MSVCVCVRCTIDWKKGKNLTVRTVKKKSKQKGSDHNGAMDTVL